MAFSNVHYVSIYQTVTSLTYVFVLLAFRPQYQQAHAERDLYFNRKHEQKEISGLPIDKAREYLQDALEGRIERQQARELGRGFEM